jgi:hypothetical protein
MIIEKINISRQRELYLLLDRACRSFMRRGIAFNVHAQCETVGNIILNVTGRKGTAQKNITVVYNTANKEWNAYIEGYKYNMLSISELGTIIRNQIQRLYTIVSKL